jgi:hypothetical protein
MKKRVFKSYPELVFFTILTLLASSCRTSSSYTYPDILNADSDSIRMSSSDTALVSIFNWARETSNGYVGNDSDPVGPWYEAALPKREAFCIRDVSHQCIGAEILWQGKQNLNMFRKFVENISEEKDFCTYWEINRYNKPALFVTRSGCTAKLVVADEGVGGVGALLVTDTGNRPATPRLPAFRLTVS